MQHTYLKRRKNSLRLKGYDYTTSGAYFVTMCTQHREYLFANINNNQMIMNDAGKMIETVWKQMSLYYQGINIDAYQVMPDHFHGIIILTGRSSTNHPDADSTAESRNRFQHSSEILSLPDAVHRFKTMTTKRYADGVNQYNWTRFNRRLWQRNYYDSIIRSEESLQRIREYIIQNPLRWGKYRKTGSHRGIETR